MSVSENTTTDAICIAANVRDATPIAHEGALAFVLGWSAGRDVRVHMLIRSRAGRWVEKWDSARRFTNWRVKRMPRAKPIVDRVYNTDEANAAALVDRIIS